MERFHKAAVPTFDIRAIEHRPFNNGDGAGEKALSF